MSSRTSTTASTGTITALQPWQAGVVGGLAGGLLFGLVMTVLTPEALEITIPSMYGQEGAIVGWAVHLVHAAILGVVFGAVLQASPLGEYAQTPTQVVSAGVVYGLVLWAVLAVVVMPIWVLGVDLGLEAIPNLETESLVGHAAYGTVLGTVTVALTE
ncbi:hypothetical protein [Halopiger goleimassiliensis]|uniref:hypothetical protein n=1 Tax=Halopiger goleimassiliensis TaxID=1293048 RepID=UPI0006775D69|nr:hypothetical protein [Halopiger goleimassiliensis]